MKRLLTPAILVSAFIVSCSAEPPPVPPVTPPPPAPSAAVAESPMPPPRPKFENPGGMWMPEQLADPSQVATLKSLGVEFDPSELSDPTSPILGAIVSLGGCSASFVSDDGLIITNHHCVQGALSYNATPDHNLIHDGYLAKTRAEEKSAGPTQRVFVTRAITDVSPKMLDGIDKITDDAARANELEKRQKQITADCEKGKTGTRCTVARYFDGAKFFQIEQMEIRDVRLVYAPAKGIGNYGGEVDNWRWPRHTGDVGFYRAYVGKDQQPADYSADNVPYKPAHRLKVATKPLTEGDFVFVAGYPGRTSRLKTAAEVKEAIEWTYPRRQGLCEDYLAAIAEVSKSDPDVGIKANTYVRGLGNQLTNIKGQLDGLVKGGLGEARTKQEGALRAWMEKSGDASYAGVLDGMNKLDAAQAKTREKDAELREVMQFARLIAAANTIVRMAEERPKADADRDPDYQERNWKRHEQGLAALEKSYSAKLDKALLVRAMTRMQKHDASERSEVFAKLIDAKRAQKDGEIAKAVDALYATTKLGDTKVRQELLTKATTAELKKNADPIIKLAMAMAPLIHDMETRDKAFTGAMAILRPRYIKALQGSSPTPISPDANSTLRITYGTVRGYKPTPDAPTYRPFTVLSEVVAKNTGKDPFDAPDGLIAAASQKKFGPYVDKNLGEVPVDFLADLHITGGNSGSATINARGEITGLVFDGNYEAMASDWLFTPSITRSIHVDIRYVLWVMDAVDGAHDLMREMGVQPAFAKNLDSHDGCFALFTASAKHCFHGSWRSRNRSCEK